MYKLLITSPIFVEDDDESSGLLRRADCQWEINLYSSARTEDELIQLIQDKDGVIVSLDPFTPRVLATVARLKVISRTGVGYDTVDVPAATRRGIIVTTTRGSNDNTVADYTFGLMLAIARRIPQNERVVHSSRWQRDIGVDINRKTLGIIGLGAIGKAVARRATGFDMRVLAYDVVRDEEFAAKYGVTYLPLEELLPQADFVTLHVSLSEATRGLISEAQLRKMKSSAYLINTSRGPVVDEAALYRALKEGWIAGAALDVFCQEPPVGSPLLTLPNVLATPHAAGVSQDSRLVTSRMACQNVVQVLRGERPLFAVNPEVFAQPSRR